MAKFVKKDKLTMKQGRIVTKKKGKVVGLPHDVFYQLSMLELAAQKLDYLIDQPDAQEAPSLAGFKKKSIFMNPEIDIKSGTPHLDKKIEEAKAIMDEIDLLSDKETIEDILHCFTALIRWCSEDEFVPGDCYLPIDTPVLGNVLELDEDYVLGLVSKIVRGGYHQIIGDDSLPRIIRIRDYFDRDGDR